MSHSLTYSATPVIELNLERKDGVRLLVKREDLNHPFVSGNKWWKLKYNLEEAQRERHKALLTFGGAYSNHLYATAAAAHELGMKSIGIVRGERTEPLNHILSFAEARGMKLHFISREAYREKKEPEFLRSLRNQFGEVYIIPEGGTNEFAVRGCAEFAKTLEQEIDFDYLCLPIGTGGTIAGMIEGLSSDKKIVGFSSLKGGDFLINEIRSLISDTQLEWQVNTDYHFGGYGKISDELLAFMEDMKMNYQLPLDQVYTAKMMTGVFDLIGQNYFEYGSTILVLHTGGLQGNGSIHKS
ncbi:MAG: 1-aminocyclopropane-1-carboxylate deaminase/D-cysteine desulfhydrase [Bacteroidetes bacterium]|nr:1-aminocyclopropane-1-carboxylate deaminase/D-cysteine desulfhydrase [Bacteroidota bacterium]